MITFLLYQTTKLTMKKIDLRDNLIKIHKLNIGISINFHYDFFIRFLIKFPLLFPLLLYVQKTLYIRFF